MSSRRRTIPRSALRLRSAEKAVPTPIPTKPEEYAPQFFSQSTLRASSEDITNVRGLSKGNIPGDVGSGALEPVVTFLERPLQKARWIGGRRGSAAILAVGSGEGAAGNGGVGLFEVGGGGKGLDAKGFGWWECEGGVMSMEEWGHGVVIAGGNDGKVRVGRLGDESLDEEGRIGGMMDVVGKVGDAKRKEGAVGIAGGVEDGILGLGSDGGMCLLDGNGRVKWRMAGMDAVGFRGVAKVGMGGGSEFVTAGASGIVGLWDARTIQETTEYVQALRHPTPGTRPLCLTVDAARPQYILAGTAEGQVAIWDRRGGDGFPLCRVELHDSFVWEVHVASASRPGLLLTCGEDASVWMLDFASAASKGMGRSGAKTTTNESNDIWRAKLTQNDIRDVSLETGATLGVNSVDFHSESDLVAYVSDSGTITVTT